MITVPEMIPANDNKLIVPYRFNWFECFIAVSCGLIAIAVTLAGMYSFLSVLGGV